MFVRVSEKNAHQYSLQQTWPMVTKYSKEKLFHHQFTTFNEEKNNFITKYIKINKHGDEIIILSLKILKLVTNSLFRHPRS